jgi:RNA-directed DNA polymerase
LCRYADDWVGAFRLQEDAERFFRVLPKRLGKFHLQVAPEKTHLRRCSRLHPSTKRRFTLLGGAFFWMPERHGVPRVMRRTARKKLQAACPRLTEWMKQHRPLPGRAFFQRLNARLRDHDNYYGVRGNARSTAFSMGRWTGRSHGSTGGEASRGVTRGSSLRTCSTASR